MSYLLDQVKEYCRHQGHRKYACVYYYCFYGHDRDETLSVLRCWLSQLCRQADSIPGIIHEMYKAAEEPSIAQLLNALKLMLDEFEVVYGFVDAVDESKAPRDEIFGVMHKILSDLEFQNLQLLTTSRDYFDIENVMLTLAVPVPMIVDADITEFVGLTLKTTPAFEKWPKDILDITARLVALKAEGMYSTLYLI